MARYYFINSQGTQIGPVERDDMLRFGITRDTLVWREGAPAWISAGQEPDLASYFASVPPAPPIPPVPPTPPVPPVPPTVPASTASASVSAGQVAADAPMAYIDFEYPGYWAAVDWTMKLFVNNQLVEQFMFKDPAKFTIPVAPGKINLRAKLSFRSDRMTLNVEPGKRYQVFLTYNRFWGSISLHQRKL